MKFSRMILVTVATMMLLGGLFIAQPVEAQGTGLYNGRFGLPKLVVCGNPPVELDPSPNIDPSTRHECTISDVFTTIRNLIQYLMILTIPMALGWFIYAGYLYITSQGDKGAVEKAKQVFRNVLIGYIIIGCAWAVVYTVLNELLDSSRGFTPLNINATN